MKATKDGWTIEGTVDEIRELIGGAKKSDEPKKKEIDWPKAEALMKAGWGMRAIAEELGTNYQTIYARLRKKAKEENSVTLDSK